MYKLNLTWYNEFMPDDQNTPQNPSPEENSIPPSPQEPTEQVSENTPHSEPSNMPPEAPEAPTDGFAPESTNSAINKGDAEISQPENEPKSPETQDSSSAESESVEADKPTAQMGRNEPLGESSQTQTQAPKNSVREILAKAQQVIQFRKRKKLDRIMSLFLQQSKITNDEVEKFLHVSDATATRYLSQLEKEGKIKQNGKTGHMVSYSRI